MLIDWGWRKIEKPWGGNRGLRSDKGEYFIYVLV